MMNSLCVLLVHPSQGLSGPPGPEGAEGKPGTQVPILYRISIPLPVNAVYMSVCHLHFLYFKKNNYMDFTNISLLITTLPH